MSGLSYTYIPQSVKRSANGGVRKRITKSRACCTATSAATNVCAFPGVHQETNRNVLATTVGLPRRDTPSALRFARY
ncbi:hypothetical protein LINGRAHAP2_LOCUS10800 [Linum grandiflorum]